MDVLKKAFSNPEACIINEDNVVISGKRYDSEELVVFPTKKSKNYTLKSVLFFLLNSEKTLKEYMSLCKENKILSVSHVDKSSIISDIQNYEAQAVRGFFIKPEYVKECNYEIPRIKLKDLLVVSDSLVSKLHIDNLEKLLSEGVFLDSTPNPLSNDKKQIQIGDGIFTVVKNVKQFTEEDWKSVKAVFLENLNTEKSRDILIKCPPETLIFTIENTKIRSIKLDISGGFLKKSHYGSKLFEKLNKIC